jgi:hypothetical protein
VLLYIAMLLALCRFRLSSARRWRGPPGTAWDKSLRRLIVDQLGENPLYEFARSGSRSFDDQPEETRCASQNGGHCQGMPSCSSCRSKQRRERSGTNDAAIVSIRTASNAHS